MKNFGSAIASVERDMKRRDAKAAKTPRVVYRGRYGGHGITRLADVGDYLGMNTWPPDYGMARIVRDEDLGSIEEAERLIRNARKAADALYAKAFQRGLPISNEVGEAARKAAG